jgi:acetyltransferase
MAIHPYPVHLIQEWECRRPGRHHPPDPPGRRRAEQEFVKNMSDESKYYRFMDTMRELTQTMLVRFTQIDYDREMALVATLPEREDGEGKEVQIGVARYVTNPDGESVEFALAVADDWQKHGVGRKLMSALIDCARQRATAPSSATCCR